MRGLLNCNCAKSRSSRPRSADAGTFRVTRAGSVKHGTSPDPRAIVSIERQAAFTTQRANRIVLVAVVEIGDAHKQSGARRMASMYHGDRGIGARP